MYAFSRACVSAKLTPAAVTWMRFWPGPGSGSGRSSASSSTSGPPHSLIRTPRMRRGLWAQTVQQEVVAGVDAAALDHRRVAGVDQQPVDHRPGEQVDEQFHVDVTADLPALHAALQHLPQRLASGFDQHGAEDRVHLRIVCGLGEQPRRERSRLDPIQRAIAVGPHRLEVAAERARVARGEVGVDCADRGAHERRLVRETPVDGRLPHPGALADRLNRQTPEALLAEDLQGCADDCCVRCCRTRATGCAGCIRHAAAASATSALARSVRRARAGRKTPATTAPVNAAPAATSAAECIPLVNALIACVVTARLPLETAATSDSRAASGAPSIPPRSPVDRTEPRMATPTAPPTMRAASFIAEPTPACSAASDPMIDSVAGAIAVPMPNAMTTIETATGR